MNYNDLQWIWNMNVFNFNKRRMQGHIGIMYLYLYNKMNINYQMLYIDLGSHGLHT